ncbi:DNA polymerase III subunit gamma/tau [Candidatus Microgenomates bacterium]|nr:DNA polymerase III subunit gamma/tau [Candidatus Microgenomates bacterium]
MASWYVKYRPQKAAELDQEYVREAILSFIKRGSFPHAILFAGPKGTGKTSAARIIAKILNCEKYIGKNKLGEPCNECTNCKEITNGSSMSVVEMDAASHRGIEDIREIREAVKLLPPAGHTKVYIIDEAHMLTTEASNALLKTLEEPPPHAVFILATTELVKILETIRSRTTIIQFSKATHEELIHSLSRVLAAEKIKVDKGVLEKIAEAAEGSFRDGIKMLEQLAEDGKITIEKLESTLLQTKADPNMLLTFLINQNSRKSLEEIEKAVNLGVNIRQYTIQLIEILHQILLSTLKVKEAKDDVKLNVGEINKLINLLILACDQMRISPIAELPLELAVVEWCGGENGKSSQSLGAASDTSDFHSSAHSTSKVKEVASTSPTSSKKVEVTDGQWKELLAKVKLKNNSLAALLHSAKPIGIEGETLTISVFYRFHKDKLEENGNRRIIEEMAAQVIDDNIAKVIFLLGEKPVIVQEESIENVVAPASEEDIVKMAEDIFKNELPN